MLVVKRYPNRKLYDTVAKQYITLEGIADIIRTGREIQVIDHVTGEDMTALTLSQIIMEQEKRQSGYLPRSILTGLIRTSGSRFSELQRSLTSPKAFLHQVDEEIKRRIHGLVKRGELLEIDAQRLLDKLLSDEPQSDDLGTLITDDQIEHILRQRSIPTRDEIDRLANQIEKLADKLDELA